MQQNVKEKVTRTRKDFFTPILTKLKTNILSVFQGVSIISYIQLLCLLSHLSNLNLNLKQFNFFLHSTNC